MTGMLNSGGGTLATLISDRRAIDRMWTNLAPTFSAPVITAHFDSAIAPLVDTLRASTFASIGDWIEPQMAALQTTARSTILEALGEQTLTVLTPFRTLAKSVLASGEFAAFRSQSSFALRKSFFDAIPGFLDDLAAPSPASEQAAAIPDDEMGEAVALTSTAILSEDQIVHARLILWLAVLFMAVFITSGSVATQVAGGADPFRGTGLGDLGGVALIILAVEKILALPSNG